MLPPESLTSTTEPFSLLREALRSYRSSIALACSFSMEDLVLINMLTQINSSPRIFALDTCRLPEETYECAEKIRLRYCIEIEWFYPDVVEVEELLRNKGLYSFRESVEERMNCCRIRKVEPLKKALAPLTAWITGQRREQSPTRSLLQRVEIDEANGGIIKLNPLADWSFADVKSYVAQNNLPYNRLYDHGYMSISCSPCSRPVASGEHERSGRWWWEDPDKKECGLHLAPAKKIINSLTDDVRGG